MPKIYSKDLRFKAVDCVKRGKSHEEICEFFGIGIATLYRWLRLARVNQSLSPVRRSNYKSSKVCPNALLSELEARPDATLSELSVTFGCCLQNIDYWLKKLGITRKKNNTLLRKERGKKAKVHKRDQKVRTR